MVRATTCVLVLSRTMRDVASRPFSRGMLTSITTTSGESAAAFFTAS